MRKRRASLKKVELSFTDTEYNALLRYCATNYFDPGAYIFISRMIILNELISANLLTQDDVSKGAFGLYDKPAEDKPAFAPKPYASGAPRPDGSKDRPKKVNGNDLKIPQEYRGEKPTDTYKVLKWLLNTMVEEGRFHKFTASDVGAGVRMTEKQAYSAMNALSGQKVTWLVRDEKVDAGGKMYWSFTEVARAWFGKHNAELEEAGIFDKVEEPA
jgi:hypothetical protein